MFHCNLKQPQSKVDLHPARVPIDRCTSKPSETSPSNTWIDSFDDLPDRPSFCAPLEVFVAHWNEQSEEATSSTLQEENEFSFDTEPARKRRRRESFETPTEIEKLQGGDLIGGKIGGNESNSDVLCPEDCSNEDLESGEKNSLPLPGNCQHIESYAIAQVFEDSRSLGKEMTKNPEDSCSDSDDGEPYDFARHLNETIRRTEDRDSSKEPEIQENEGKAKEEPLIFGGVCYDRPPTLYPVRSKYFDEDYESDGCE